MKENNATQLAEPPDEPTASDRAGNLGVNRMERARTVSLAVLALVAVFATLYVARAVLFPIVVAVLLNLLLSPLVAFLHRLRIPNSVGAALVLIVLLAIVGRGETSLVSAAAN